MCPNWPTALKTGQFSPENDVNPFYDSGHTVEMLYFENLALEIHATKAGWEVVKPPRVKGTSGVDHRFSFMASKGAELVGFDLYPQVTGIEVLKTYIKSMDAGIDASIVCLSGKPTEEGRKLAKEYGLTVLSPAEIEQRFEPAKELAPEVTGISRDLYA